MTECFAKRVNCVTRHRFRPWERSNVAGSGPRFGSAGNFVNWVFRLALALSANDVGLMAWQVVMIATEERVDELSGLMWSLGTLGVEVRDQRGHNEDDHLVNRVEVRASFAHRVVADEAMTAVEALGP